MEKAALKRRSGSDSRNLAAIEDEDEETLTEDDEDGDEDAEEEEADLDEAPFAAGDDFWCCESAAADDEGEPSSEMVIQYVGDRSKVETRRVVTNIARRTAD